MIKSNKMQTDNPSSSGSSSSSNLESPQNGTKSKSKDNIYRKFFKTNTGGNKLLRQGHSPCTPPTERHYIEEKENDYKSNTASNVYNSTFGANAASEAGNHASSATSSATASSFPSFVPGRQTYPKVQNADQAKMIKVQ